jgi:hypothetical protein
MKKLMIAAATAALAGATFAANVYDYKASVKYVDFKKVTVQKVKYDVKTVKSATLKGYLVTPEKCGCTDGADGVAPSFLVVQNNKKYGPKLLPANLLSKVWRTSATSKTLEADGYLFAGVMDQDSATTGNFVAPQTSTAYDFGDCDANNMTLESEHLFGAYNEGDYDKQGNLVVFVEAWLTHAGFGKATSSTTADAGCKKGSTGVCLTSLSGSVVGGSFTCKANEIYYDEATQAKEGFLCQGWNLTKGNQNYLMEVISGTWSIKANTKIEASTLTPAEQNLVSGNGPTATELGYVKACGEKLSKGYDLTQVEANFAAKWF